MADWDEATAATYDIDEAAMFAPEVLEPAVETLARLAAGRRVLEFAARGLDVAAIEQSPAMAARLAAKPGAERIALTIGDMATTRVEGTFGLVFVAYNTITNLLTQDEQVACFANAAAHLEPGGCFVIEVFVPQLRRLPPGERHVVFDVRDDAGTGHLGVDTYDVVAQRLTSHHAVPGRPFTRTEHRYAWPAEYDLMARLAGLERHDRSADWLGAPFTADSPSHVSIYRRPAAR